MSHLVRHLGIAVVGLVVLPVFGVPWQTALYVGLMAGCVLMGFGGGHRGHSADGPAGSTSAHEGQEVHQ